MQLRWLRRLLSVRESGWSKRVAAAIRRSKNRFAVLQQKSAFYVNNDNDDDNDDGDDDDDDGGGGRGQGVLKEGGLGASSRASVGEISVVYCLQFKVMT